MSKTPEDHAAVAILVMDFVAEMRDKTVVEQRPEHASKPLSAEVVSAAYRQERLVNPRTPPHPGGAGE